MLKLEKRTILCDVRNIAIEVVLEIGGIKVEDEAWLQKAGDFNHINVAELDGMLKWL